MKMTKLFLLIMYPFPIDFDEHWTDFATVLGDCVDLVRTTPPRQL